MRIWCARFKFECGKVPPGIFLLVAPFSAYEDGHRRGDGAHQKFVRDYSALSTSEAEAPVKLVAAGQPPNIFEEDLTPLPPTDDLRHAHFGHAENARLLDGSHCTKNVVLR